MTIRVYYPSGVYEKSLSPNYQGLSPALADIYYRILVLNWEVQSYQKTQEGEIYVILHLTENGQTKYEKGFPYRVYNFLTPGETNNEP